METTGSAILKEGPEQTPSWEEFVEINELCDADSIAAAQIVVRKGDAQLALCQHHYRKHFCKLTADGWK